MVASLNDSNINSTHFEIFRHLKADKTAADYGRSFDVVIIGIFADFEGIFNRAECEDIFTISFAEIGNDRLCTRG